ncbi:MAG: spermidine synthase [Armatimonadota bacterium]
MRSFLLLLVAFLSGAILMALELVGSRVLAPHFGGSIFVWGSLIGVFLAALSIGYYLGGRMVDRRPSASLLAFCLALAGLHVLLLPMYKDTVCIRASDAFRDDRAGSLITCMVLFFVPGMLMAVTSPFVIRLTARSVSQVGRTSGVVYAVSTVGSIAGTLGTAFYLVSEMGTRNLLYLLGVSLIFTALIALALAQSRKAGAAAVVLAALLLPVQPALAAERILLERDSAYHKLIVSEDNRYRWLRADDIWHTQMTLKDPNGRGLPYTDYVDLALLYNPNIRSVLVIGLGGGTIPKRFVRDYPQVKVDCVEIDPAVIKIAQRYFYVEPGPRLKIYESDGRQFLRRTKRTWDLIVLDAYYADTVPFFLTTREFFTLAESRLNPGGVLCNNVVGQVVGPRSKFFRSVYKTMAEVFPQMSAVKVAHSGAEWVNIEVFGVKSRRAVSLAELRKRAAQLKGKLIKDDELLSRLDGYVTEPVRTKDVPELSDDYAPTDALIHLW